MRFPFLSVPFCLFISVLAHTQALNRTDVQTDGFVGPVKAVSTQVKFSGVKWQQPGGPTLVMPIWCHDCEYDRDGFRNKSGQTTNGHFIGELDNLVRDENGHVTHRFVFDAISGQLQSDIAIGPFGKTEETDYTNGKLRCRQIFSYDQYGHITEWLTLDGTGQQEGKNVTRREPDGTLQEESVWGKNR